MKTIYLSILTLALFTFQTSIAGVVTLPYSNDFSSDANDFTSTGGWSYNGGSETFDVTVGSAGDVQTASVTATDLGGPASTASDFVLSTAFTVDSGFTGGSSSLGFGALSNTTDFSDTFYLADITGNNGRLRIVSIDPGNGNSVLTTQDFGGLSTSRTYTLTLTGIYDNVGETLELTLNLTDDLGRNDTVTTSAFSSPFGGDSFGYRLRSPGGSTSGFTAEMDDFSLNIVPEPATSSAVLVGGLLFALGRRRCSTNHEVG